MKVVVISDVHGNRQAFNRIISFNPDADYIISLGDSELQYSELQKHNVICVKGNYPFDAGVVYEQEIKIKDTKLFITHGHRYKVRRGIDHLYDKGLELSSDIVLYGHTHIAKVDYRNKIYIINPGSVSRSRNHMIESYLILYIENNNQFKYEYKEARTNKNIDL